MNNNNNNNDSNNDTPLLSLSQQFNDSLNSLMRGVAKEMEKLQTEREQFLKEKEQWEQTSRKFQQSIPRDGDGKIIKLDVGGTLFTTSLDTLTSNKGSFFDLLFSGRFELKKESSGSIFIDRNPKHFGYILDFMRGSFPPIENFTQREKDELKIEADFYQLTELANLLTSSPTPSLSSLSSLSLPILPLPTLWKWKDGPNYAVSNNGLTISKTDQTWNWTVTALAKQNIDVTKKGKHSWKVRIDKGIHHMIGVANSLLDQTVSNNHDKGVGWFFYTWNSTIYHAGDYSSPYPRLSKLPIGTVIGVHLDLDRCELSFSVNDEMKGVAVRDFPINKFPMLTLACSFSLAESEVTIVE